MYINREEYEKRLEGMSEIFKSMLDEAFKKALVFAQQNNLPPTIRRIEVTGGAARTYLFMNIISQYITDHKQVYEVRSLMQSFLPSNSIDCIEEDCVFNLDCGMSFPRWYYLSDEKSY